MRVRGGGKVDITWKAGQLAELRLQSDHAKKYRLSYGNQAAEVQFEVGKPIVLDGGFHGVSQ
ncbi:MAG: hypothetical protein ACHQIK_23000 [Candidatus Acidiferrales bacterium]